MIDVTIERQSPTPEELLEAAHDIQRDDFGYFLEHDPELQIAYAACLQAVGIEWTDEEIVEAAFKHLYGDNVDSLMQTWRFRQELKNCDPHAIAVHNAVMKRQRRQATNPRHTN